MNATSTGYCNCCAAEVPLLTTQLGGSVCSICRRYDVTSRHIMHTTREEFRSQRLHDLANIFESAFGGAQ
jgi:transposase-like protein